MSDEGEIEELKATLRRLRDKGIEQEKEVEAKRQRRFERTTASGRLWAAKLIMRLADSGDFALPFGTRKAAHNARIMFYSCLAYFRDINSPAAGMAKNLHVSMKEDRQGFKLVFTTGRLRKANGAG